VIDRYNTGHHASRVESIILLSNPESHSCFELALEDDSSVLGPHVTTRAFHGQTLMR
jgi:hypothetical protein